MTEFASAIAKYFAALAYFYDMEFCRQVRLRVWYRGDSSTLGDGVTLGDVAKLGGMWCGVELLRCGGRTNPNG